jgi:hypothetical protein
MKNYVDRMVEEAWRSTAEGGLKSQSWNKLVIQVSKHGKPELEKQGRNAVTKAQLQSKYGELKKKYSLLSKLVSLEVNC